MIVFKLFYEMELKTLSLKSCQFEASKDIITKFKPQALHIIRIKFWNPSGSGNPPSLIPALRIIAILGLKTGLWQWHNGISALQCTYLYMDIYFPLNLDKKKHFWTTYPPHLVHVVFERPLIFWILFVHEIGPFMPNSSVFIKLM